MPIGQNSYLGLTLISMIQVQCISTLIMYFSPRVSGN